MTGQDRLVVGFDLIKDAHVLERAYNAGEPNRMFFVHMLRRINRTLGADFDLDAFELGSRFVAEPPRSGLGTWRVELRVVTRRDQDVTIPALDRRLHLAAGDAVQVGISRKFSPDDIATLATLSGLAVRSMWFDPRHHFALGELVRDDAHTRRGVGGT
jgi:L-histidine N-alpha-methyltransferase